MNDQSEETELKLVRCAKHNCEAVAMEAQDLDGDWRYWVTCKHIIEPCKVGLSASKNQIHELWSLRQEAARTAQRDADFLKTRKRPDPMYPQHVAQLLKDKEDLETQLEFLVKAYDESHHYLPARFAGLAVRLKISREYLARLSPQEPMPRCHTCLDTGEVKHPDNASVKVLCPKSCPASLTVLHQEFSKQGPAVDFITNPDGKPGEIAHD